MSFLKKKFTIEVAERDGFATGTLINHDIVPMPPSRRTWDWLEYTGFFFISNFSVGVWAVAAALLGLGMAVWEAMVSIMITALVIFLVGGANGWVGGEWHIGYTVFQRVIFGMRGSYLAMILRIILSIVSFASQAWVGGLCMTAILSSWSKSFLYMENTLPESAHMVTRDLVGFTVFQIISIPLLFIRPEKIATLIKFANVLTFFCMLGITIWATKQGGYGPLLKQGSSYTTFSRSWAWFYSITSTLGAISAGLINQADFTRFTKKQGRQLGPLLASVYLPGVLVPLMGLLTASATVNIWGESYWNPVTILMKWMTDDYSAKSRAAAFFCGFGFMMSQLTFNTIGNGFAAGMDLAGLVPRYINIRRGALLCAALSWVVQPWLFYNTSSTFIAVMSSFSVFLAPLTGIMITDYFFLRKQKIELSALYTLSPEGSYYYTHGFNWRAILVWVVIFVPAMPGMIANVNPSVKVNKSTMYYFYGNYFFGFLEASTLYYLIQRFFPAQGLGKQDTHDIYGTFTPEEAEKKGMVPYSPRAMPDDYDAASLHKVESLVQASGKQKEVLTAHPVV